MTVPASREAILAKLVERNRVWPLIDSLSCRACAIPRQEQYHRGFATCYDCGQLASRYRSALADLHPITYTTRDWSVGASMRRFKDSLGCDPDGPVAAGYGAVLSAYLEAQADRIAPRGGFDLVVAVPSSSPAIANALARAGREGWWVPDLHSDIAVVREGFPRQRARPAAERADMVGKWEIVDPTSTAGSDILVLDDILTTGNTVHSFASALRAAGARSVRAVVLARNVGSNGAWIRPLLEAAVAGGRRWAPGIGKRDVIR